MECRKRKLEIRAKQKKSIKERRHAHEEERHQLLLDVEAQCKGEEARAQRLKEKRRLAREEKFRMRIDPEAAKKAENSRSDDEVEHSCKDSIMIAGNRRSKGKVRVAVRQRFSRKKRAMEELRILNSEPLGNDTLRMRVKGEVDSANNKCKSAEEETAESILSLGTPNSMLTRAFGNSFVDPDQSENEADSCFAGCLTQRIGLDVPTPKSVVKDNLARNRSHLSKVRWENQCEHELFKLQMMKGIDSVMETSSNQKCVSLKADGEREPKKHRKIFGSRSSGSKSREHNSTDKKRLPLSVMPSTGAPKSKTRQKLPSLVSTNVQTGHLPGKIDRGNTSDKFQSRSTDRENKSMAGAGNDKVITKDIELGHSLESSTPSYRLKGSTKGGRDERTKAQTRSVDVHSTGPPMKKLKCFSSSIIAHPEKAPDPNISDGKCEDATVSSTRKNPMPSCHSQKHPSVAAQVSGISSGERSLSKSRRRKGNIGVFAAGVGGKSVSERVDDFSFNF
jgi:hypothetical protein